MQTFKKVSLVLFVLVAIMFIAGCQDYGQTPRSIIEAKRPLILISKSENGVVFRDAKGNVYSFDETFYFAQNIITGQLLVGEALTKLAVK
jgi:uncharacterized lipoprotein YehR (DUF1307 family)